MCPSLAEPDSSGFPRNGFHNVSRETLHILAANTKPQAKKSFLIQQFFKNVGEVWASSPHLQSKLDFAICFPAAIASFETVQFKQD